MSAVADKLREARAYLKRKGWTQGDYACGTHVCAVGALQAVINGHPDNCELSDVLKQSESLIKTAVDARSIIWWNDRPERTQADVLAAFDKAIELAEQSL